ncbi:MAG: NF038122 family metalloprotease [Acidobacteriota bacterium]|nr:NF038122 family metalloprotease [Acidobacteriota bacterium]
MKKIGNLITYLTLVMLVHSAIILLVPAQKPLTSPPSASSRRKPMPVPETEQEGFIVYQSSRDVGCREATVEETRRIRKPGVDSKLIMLNHVSEMAARGDTDQSQTATTADAVTPGLKIVLRGSARLEGQYPEVKAAFVRAAATWEALIKSDITIVIDVDYGPDRFGEPWGENVLGSTSSVSFSPSYTEVRDKLRSRSPSAEELAFYNALPNGSLPTDVGAAFSMRVVTPIARSLGIIAAHADPASTDRDISIGFNSASSFDFNPGDGISAGLTDFDAVAVHEMGHALGFGSAVRNAGSTTALRPTIWDMFRFRPGTASLATFGSTPRILTTGASATDPHVCFNGGPELALSTGDAEGAGGDGEQASHWKDDRLNGRVYIGIMDPTISPGRRMQITDNDRKALDTFGYVVGAIPPPPPPPANDNFANATPLNGLTGTLTGTNVSATKEAGEPVHPDSAGGTSVWYRWQAPTTGSAVIDTSGSSFDTILAVYRGGSVSALTLVANGANDDLSPPDDVDSRVTISVTAGEVYNIVVDGYDGDFGGIVLNWTLSGNVPAGTVQFGAGAYTVPEASGVTASAVLTVVRGGDLAAAATVNYATTPDAGVVFCRIVSGVASDRCDFVAAVGTLRFAVGQSSATITVPIIDDGYAEGNETVNISLSSPTGMTLGTLSTASIGIIDDDAVSSVANPVDALPFFLRQQYLDFLSREPDPGGFNGWMTLLNQCPPSELDNRNSALTCTRIDVSSAFFRSTEFQLKGYFVYRFYVVSLGVRPQYTEFLADARRVTGATDQELEANRAAFPGEWVTRQRFRDRYDALTNAAYVTTLVQTAGVVLPQSNQLIDDLNAGRKTRAQVLSEVVESAEVNNKFYNEAFVSLQYFGYLRRDSDFDGFNGWLNYLNRTGNYREMVWGFLYSPEYKLRFGPVPGF